MLKSITYEDLTNKIVTFAESKYAWTLFVITAFLIFSPFFLKFNVIISTTDNVFGHFPNILYGYRALHSGNFGLWNPYILTGTDFTTSMHNHMLNPFNWFLLLFPEKYLFHALTMKIFIEYVLIGVMALKIFQLYCEKIAALLLAIAAQLCTFTWFTTTTLIGTDLLLFSLIFIYVILTAQKRRHITNFILMSICAFGIFIVGHVGYIAAFFFPVITVFFIKYWKQLRTPWRGIPMVFLAAMLMGLAMAAVRLAPITIALFNNQAIQNAWPPTLGSNNSYFTLTGFIPTIFGDSLGESALIFLNLADFGRHIQFHNLLYFGTIPIFLILLASLGNFGKYARLVALVGLAFALTHMYLMQPLSDIVNFITMPFIHDIVPRTAYPFLFLATLLITINYIRNTEFKISDTSLRFIIVLVGFVLGATITVWLKYLATTTAASMSHWTLLVVFLRILLGIVTIGSICYAWFIKINDETARKLTNYTFILAILMLLSPIACLILNVILSHKWLNWFSLRVFVYTCGIMLWSVATLVLLRKQKINKLLIILFIISLIFLIAPLNDDVDQSLKKTITTAYLGVINFMVLAALSWELLIGLAEKKLDYLKFVTFLILIVTGDLLFNVKLYSYAGARSFAPVNYLYPPITDTARLSKLDLKQYRVNHPSFFIPAQWGEVYANIDMTYGIRTYSGVDSIVNSPLLFFLDSFQKNDTVTPRGIIPTLTNPKLLDLAGVKYDFNPKGELIIRPNALARLSEFTDYKVLPDAKSQIQQLKQANFDVTKTVLINKKPNWPSATKPLQRFHAIDFASTNSSHIDTVLDLKHPTIVLFDDSYSPNWRATWNDKPIPVFLANGNFMAVSLPAGSGKLSFEFRPILFLRLAKLSWALATILLLLSIYAALTAFYRLPKNVTEKISWHA